jgi:hypothetical protein
MTRSTYETAIFFGEGASYADQIGRKLEGIWCVQAPEFSEDLECAIRSTNGVKKYFPKSLQGQLDAGCRLFGERFSILSCAWCWMAAHPTAPH